MFVLGYHYTGSVFQGFAHPATDSHASNAIQIQGHGENDAITKQSREASVGQAHSIALSAISWATSASCPHIAISLQACLKICPSPVSEEVGPLTEHWHSIHVIHTFPSMEYCTVRLLPLDIWRTPFVPACDQLAMTIYS